MSFRGAEHDEHSYSALVAKACVDSIAAARAHDAGQRRPMIDWTTISDEDVFAALEAQATDNPSGASYIDVLDQWGAQQAINAALERLVILGHVIRTTPGNYLPTENYLPAKGGP